MDLYLVDENFNRIAIIDSFESFNMTEVYNGYGTFELIIKEQYLRQIRDFYARYYYIMRSDSKRAGIVESISYTEMGTDYNIISVKGRTLEAMLERRSNIVYVRSRGLVFHNRDNSPLKAAGYFIEYALE